MEVAHIDVFRRDPERFWHFYGDRFQTLEGKQPNGAHRALAALEREGLLERGDHAEHRPPARQGRQPRTDRGPWLDRSFVLPALSRRYPLAEVRARQARRPRRDPSVRLRAPLKPDVVLFGEYLPVAALHPAEQLAASADLMLCIGSSLEVHPVAQLPQTTLDAGGRIAIITQGPTPYDGRATARCGGDVVDEMAAIRTRSAPSRVERRRVRAARRLAPATRPRRAPARTPRPRRRPRERARQGGLGGAGDRLALAAQLVEAPGQLGGMGAGGELGQRGVERHEQLQRRLPRPPLIEIQPRAQRQLLAGEGLVSRTAAPRPGGPGAPGRACAGAGLRAPGAPWRRSTALGHLLAGAEADAGDDHLAAADRLRYGSAVMSRKK